MTNRTVRTPFFVRDKGFYRNVLRLAIPLTLQSAMGLLLNMMDTVMLGRLGENSEAVISAASLANQPFTIYSILIFGIASGASVLISQYWGKQDTDSINSITGIITIISLVAGGLVTVLCYFFAPEVMSLYTSSPLVIELGVSYLYIVLASYPITSMTSLLCSVMRSTEQVKVALVSNSAAILTNILLNYILIFGKLGFPALGIVGAAIATLIARIAELLMVLFYVIFMEKQVRLSLRKMLRIRGVLVRDLCRYSLPTITSETFWGLGITCHAAIIGNMGEIPYAAYSVANIIESIGLLATMGFATAALVIIGKEIGAGREHNAYPYAKTLLTLATILGALMSGVVVLLARPAVNLFNIVDATKDTAVNIILVIAVLVFIKSFNATAIVGVFRGGGDTVTAMLMDSVCMWTISVPMGLLAAYVLELPVWWVYAFLMTDEVVKIFIGFKRVTSRKWIRNVTR